MFTDFIKDHFFHPRNVGTLDGADAVGRAGSLTCGATVHVWLRVADSHKIVEAKFKAAGCSILVASTSFLTEQIKDKSTGEAAVLAQSPESAIIKYSADVPEDRVHCAALACKALISAITSYSDAVRDEWSGDEALICTCFCISERTIEREIHTGGLRRVVDVTKACNAGAGCRSCCSLIEEMLDDHWRSERLRA